MVQYHESMTPRSGDSYTVERYESDKVSDGAGSWRHTEIRLLPENPDFAPIILRDVRDDEFHVLAEVVEVFVTS